MNKIKVLAGMVFGVLSTCAASVWAQSETLTYKGVPLGASMAEFVGKLPDYQCRGTTCTYLHSLCDTKLNCKDRNSFGGAMVDMGTVKFRDEKLALFNLVVPSAYVDILIAVLRERMGAESRLMDEPLRTRGGAVVPNVEATWETAGMVLVVKRHSYQVGKGSVMLTTPAELAAFAADRNAEIKKSAKDF